MEAAYDTNDMMLIFGKKVVLNFRFLLLVVYLVDMVQPKAIGQGSVLFSGNYGCNDTLFPQAICIAIFDMYYDTYLNTFYRN
jgi:hypothetical protein